MSIKFQHLNEVDAIFNSPGCDPFYASETPKSHYIPTLLHETSKKLKNTVLTPEKIERIPVKDNDCYIPLSYSFCEEESDTSRENLHEPFKLSLDALNFIDSTEEVKSGLDDKNGSDSHASKTKEVSSEPQLNTNEKIFLSEEELEPKKFMKPKMSSTQRSTTSNIAQLVNRFRYGKPLPPSERKRQNISNQLGSIKSTTKARPPSGGSKKHFDWLNSDVTSSNSSKLAESTPDSHQSHNSSIDELHQRVEKILKESTSALQSQSSSDTTVWSSQPSVLSKDVSTSKPPSAAISTSDPTPQKQFSASNISGLSRPSSTRLETAATKHSRDCTTPVEKENDHTSTSKLEFSSSVSTLATSGPTKPALYFPPPIHSQPQPRDVSPCPPATRTCSPAPPAPIPFQEDILQQWRLKRKMEAARSATENPVAKSHFKQAEKPLDLRHPTERRNVGVSAVPMATVQTQTSPTSSLSELASHTSSDRVEKNDNITMHKVTVVSRDEPRPTPPPSVSSQVSSADMWSDSKLSESTAHSRKKSRTVKSSPSKSVASPTTTMVKKVVGAHLFDVSSDALPASESTHLKTTSDDTFESSQTEQTINDKSSYLESKESISDSNSGSKAPVQPKKSLKSGSKNLQPQSATSEMIEDPDVVLKDLLERISQDSDDFKDDPVLISLREQRKKYVEELFEIEKKLQKLEETS